MDVHRTVIETLELSKWNLGPVIGIIIPDKRSDEIISLVRVTLSKLL